MDDDDEEEEEEDGEGTLEFCDCAFKSENLVGGSDAYPLCKRAFQARRMSKGVHLRDLADN